MHIIGHRGAMTVALENTLESFALAEQLEVDAIELDIHATADGHLAVIHDTDAARVAAEDSPHRDTPILELTRSQVDEITLRHGQTIPTLAEVLDATTTPLQVEIKAAGAVAPLIELLRSRPEQRDRIMVTTFQDDLLRQVAAERLGVELGIIRSRHDPERLGIFVDCPGLTHYFPGWAGFTAELVAGIHERRLRTGVWPVRTLAELDRAIELGVDAVTVDDPELFIAKLRDR